MPYVSCPSCSLPTYIVSEGTCPVCGAQLKSPRRGVEDSVRAELAMLCRELAMDSALVSEISGGRERVRWAAGAGDYANVSLMLEDTICQRLLDGRIGALVPDTAAEPSLAALEPVRSGDIAAYLGVPFRTADARLYVLCCLAGEARHDLAEADVRFVRGLAESVRSLLEPSSPPAWA
jgi:GAF domain-containing protein